LVGTDFSRASGLAIAQAWELASQREDGELHVVHVVDHRRGFSSKNAELRRREKLLEHLPAALRNYSIQVEQACQLAPLWRPFAVHVRIGRPAEEIHQLAIDLDAALIVVGSHDRHGLDRLVMGSVSKRLVREAHMPVLVARHKHVEDVRHTVDEAPEPACDACLAERRASGGARLWCAEHDHARVPTHVYSWTQRDSWKGSADSGSAFTAR
jgi:nucleotide-binding universal stress UspA family protein